MIARALALLAVMVCAVSSQAATVKFSGQWSLLVGPDVLAINNDIFLATLETNNGAGVISGQIWMNPATPASTETFVLAGGTVSTQAAPPRTFFNGVAGGGGVLNFTVASQAPTLDQAGLNTLLGSGGTVNWLVGLSIYQATIQVVPEPSSALALCGLVGSVIAFGRRRRSA